MVAIKSWTVSDPIKAESGITPSASHNLAIDYLRGFLTLMVLAFHSFLAYLPVAPSPPASLLAIPRWWGAFPVVDSGRWFGFLVFVAFFELFAMPLMFLLSGLFLWPSLARKGLPRFLRDRFFRLGVPFFIAFAIIPLCAYYPTFLQTGSPGGFHEYWRQWLALGYWPTAHLWFLSLLLAFDCLVAVTLAVLPAAGSWLGDVIASLCRPSRLFAAVVLIAGAIYLPMALRFGVSAWWTFGPLNVQISRVFLYLFVFLLGVGWGTRGLERSHLSRSGPLAKKWLGWAIFAVIPFLFTLALALLTINTHSGFDPPRVWNAIQAMAYVISCMALCFASLALFLRFAQRRLPVFDSLCENAYGMYLVHYLFVTWLQFSLLQWAISPVVKGMFVFLCTVALSWIATITLRCIPVAGRWI